MDITKVLHSIQKTIELKLPFKKLDNLKKENNNFIAKLILVSFFLLVNNPFNFGQKNVSITIDDVPNTNRFQKDGYYSPLLHTLDSLSIPIAIFINEGLLYRGDSISENFEIFIDWFKKDYITVGNHTFYHSHFSSAGIDSFQLDILKGEYISRELSKVYKKPLSYFRFPYNDLGADSLQHVQMQQFLEDENYISTPFTIESSDWMFNSVYEFYLEKDQLKEAEKIGMQYVEKTLAYFDFYDQLSNEKYGRSIHQIYLCHDNKLNADFLELIINKLKSKDYNFISLDDAMSDKAYDQDDEYYKKWGVSWFYRWMKTQKERVGYMKQEPSTTEVEMLFKKINE